MLKQTLKILLTCCILAVGADAASADGNADLDSCTAAGRADDFPAAIKYCTSAIESKDLPSENEATAFQNRGIAYTYLRKPDEAIADFSRGIALNPQNASLFAGRGWALQQKQAFAESMADLDHALALDPHNVSALTNRALALVKAERYEEALRDSSHAIEIDPNVAAAYDNRANAYQHLGKSDAAMVDYDHAIALDPKQAMAYNDRGTAYGEQQRFDLALADFDRAIGLDPEVANFHFNRGLTYLRMKQDERASADFRATLALEPDHAWAHKDLGDILVRQGRFAEARIHYNGAIRWQPDQASFYRARAMASLNLGEYPAAVEDADHALSLESNDAKALGIIGFAQFLAGDFAKAAITFEIDLRSGTGSPHAMIYWYLASQRAHGEHHPALSAYLGNAHLSQWPNPLLGHLQGSVTEQEVLKSAQATEARAAAAQLCQARFVLGEMALLVADSDAAARQFEQAVAICPKSMLDYAGAKTELSRLR